MTTVFKIQRQQEFLTQFPAISQHSLEGLENYCVWDVWRKHTLQHSLCLSLWAQSEPLRIDLLKKKGIGIKKKISSLLPLPSATPNYLLFLKWAMLCITHAVPSVCNALFFFFQISRHLSSFTTRFPYHYLFGALRPTPTESGRILSSLTLQGPHPGFCISASPLYCNYLQACYCFPSRP